MFILCVWLFQIEREPCPHCAVLLQRWLPNVSFFKIDSIRQVMYCDSLKLRVHGERVIKHLQICLEIDHEVI